MSSVIHCPNCKTPLFVPQEMVGQVMACPTCQRPIQFVAPGAPPPPTATSPAAASTPRPIPKAAPLAAPHSPTISLEPAPAAPKFSAETTQLALRPVTSSPLGRPKDDSVSPVTIATWAAVATLVLASGIVVLVVSNSGSDSDSDRDKQPVAKAQSSAERPPPPPMLSIPRAGQGSSKKSLPPATDDPPPASYRPPVAKAPYLPPAPVSAAAPRLPPPPLPSDVRTGSPYSDVGNSAVSASSPVSASASAGVDSSPSAPRESAGILDAIDDAWRLPALISTADEPMARLAEDPTEPVNIALSSTLAAISPQAALFTEKEPQDGTWTVMYVADLQSPDTKVPLATMQLKGRQFSFAWKSLELTELRRQVANCKLEIHHGNHRKVVQLRPRQQEAACRLDLEKDVQVREFAVSDLPKPDLLRLEITGLDGFQGDPKLATNSLALGKETAIAFKDPPGAEIGLSFKKQASGNLMVRLEPVFREAGAKEFEMTLKRLDTMEDGVSRAMRAAEKELPNKQREVANLRKAYSKVKGNRPSNPLLVPAWQTELTEIGKDLDRAANRVVVLQKLIPVQKARLEAVPKIRAFLAGMHQTAVIRMRVVVEGGEQDLVLVDATVPSQGVALPDSNSQGAN